MNCLSEKWEDGSRQNQLQKPKELNGTCGLCYHRAERRRGVHTITSLRSDIHIRGRY